MNNEHSYCHPIKVAVNEEDDIFRLKYEEAKYEFINGIGKVR